MRSNIFQRRLANYEKLVLAGSLILSAVLISYGVWALVSGICHVGGRGNPPIGTIVTFHGLEARLLSNIYTGGGIAIFAHAFLSKLHYSISVRQYAKPLCTVGLLLLALGMLSLAAILCLPLIRVFVP